MDKKSKSKTPLINFFFAEKDYMCEALTPLLINIFYEVKGNMSVRTTPLSLSKLSNPKIETNICDLTKLRALARSLGGANAMSETVKSLLCSLTEGKTEF